MTSKQFYITTPIYYVNDIPHIGHAYTTFIADFLARYHRLRGEEVYFLTGTDEHGQKIEQSALKKQKHPKAYVDEISQAFKELWDGFGISYDIFIRTTHPYHIQTAQMAFLQMYQKGDIYKGEYEGQYCISCESFFPLNQLQALKCPDCGKQTSPLKEESYFFALSKYEQRLLDFYEANPHFILPKAKRNEVVKFVQSGLSDLSITRTSFDWGIRLHPKLTKEDSNNQNHVLYVWLDALVNYLSGIGYENNLHDLKRFWPPNYHLVGKDILRFHAIYWPAFLMSMELPLPHHVAAHGWWTIDGQKMSKSLGNVVNPKEVALEFGLEPFRYFLLREVAFGQDGDYSKRALIDRINADLSKNLGNLLNRLLGMASKYFSHHIKTHQDLLSQHFGDELLQIHAITQGIGIYFDEVQTHKCLEEIWKIFSLANLAIQKSEPWRLFKEGRSDEVECLLVFVSNALIQASLLLYPAMPQSAEKILSVFGLEPTASCYESFIFQQQTILSLSLSALEPLFPKVQSTPPPQAEQTPQTQKPNPQSLLANELSFDDFSKIDLRVGTIIEAIPLEKSEKLLKLQVDLGEERPRQIIAGIKHDYSPQELLQTQVCVVANLKPAMLMGYRSEGMILASKDKQGLSLIRPQETKQNGSKIR